MSDECRAYVKLHSPFRGTAFLVHYMMGDLANSTHDYRLFMTDKRLAADCRISVKSLQRARADITQGGFLEVLNGTASRGNPLEYRFLFPEPKGGQSDHLPLDPKGGQSVPKGGQNGPLKVDNSESSPITNQRGTKGTSAGAVKPKATDDPLTKHAHELAVFAMEQPIKPVLRSDGDAFSAVMKIIKSLLHAGHSVQKIRQAIESGIEVWTVAGFQTTMARANPRRKGDAGRNYTERRFVEAQARKAATP